MTHLSLPLAIVGNLNVDLWVHPVDRFPSRDEEHIVDSARVELAGTAGYALLACEALGLKTVTVSTIGDDALGQIMMQSATRSNITLQDVEVLEGQETPLSMVFINTDGSRCIISTVGAHARMDVDVVRSHDSSIAGCLELFICGSYLLPQLGPAAIREYALTARRRGQIVAFDPSWDPAGWTDRLRRETLELLHTVDVYMPNMQELSHVTGHADWQEAAREISGIPGEVIIKRGAQGACFVDDAGEWIEVPGFEVHAVNTIGAGDVFDMGYLFARRMAWAPRQRLEFASALAAIVVAQAGTRQYPSMSTVLSFLRDRVGDERWGPNGPVPADSI
jgi:ribokinase